ncbi:MAG: hypothetical protein ACLQDV_09035 [Candidatus Binataceae bacterium]
MLILVWRTHYYFFRRYGLHDASTMALNAILLFVVLCYVYPLKFVFNLMLASLFHDPMAPTMRPDQSRPLMVIFSAGYTAALTP